jgi:hypothetical protein
MYDRDDVVAVAVAGDVGVIFTSVYSSKMGAVA